MPNSFHAWIGLLAACIATLCAPARAQSIEIKANDRILLAGNTFAERVAQSGYLEAAIQAAFPEDQITLMQVPWSADEVSLRPREKNVPTTEDYVRDFKPTVLLLCYGMSESFQGQAGLEQFGSGLRSYVASLRDAAAPGARIVLISPIAHEDLGSPWPTGQTVADHNRDLRLYCQVMKEAAGELGAAYVDLYTPSIRADASPQLTTNGIHPNESGCASLVDQIGRQLGWWDATTTSFTDADLKAAHQLRTLACDKFWLERLWYRPTNTAYVFGDRHEPFGVVNFPPEMAQLRRMIDARTTAMWTEAKPAPQAVLADVGAEVPLWEHTPSRQTLPEDSWTPPKIEAKGTETSVGSLDIKSTDEFLKSFTLPEGHAINCFASEEDFPELANPLALTFDDEHRLWVLCAPTYPHLEPGAFPQDKLLVIEDIDHDGHADRCRVFADGLYIPTGFAIDHGDVYVGDAPDLLRLRDTDGDGVADRREVIATGFAMPDAHHQLGAFEWDPSGGFLLHEGIFSRANVETPWGTRRTSDASVWRFEPRTQRLDVMSHSSYLNPWGHVFDDYGQSVLADASGGDNFDFSHVIAPFRYPYKPAKPAPILNRGRPTAGCEIIHTRQFPDDVQGSYLVNQCIGFHGTRWDMLKREGSTWTTQPMPTDLVSSSDTNFRPVACEIGPDGTLYLVDWCNPLIGHMQYSVRDPRRDHTHGRIWRIRYIEKPLVDIPDIAHATVPQLLEMLRLPETNTRQLVRRKLQTLPLDRVESTLRGWIAGLSETDPLHDRLQLEELWILNGHGIADPTVMATTLGLATPEARAAAVRMLRHWLVEKRADVGAAKAWLNSAVADDDMLVRLEAVVACGFLDAPDAVEIAAQAAAKDMDESMRVTFNEVISYLGVDSGSVSEIVQRIRLERMPPGELQKQEMTPLVAQVMLRRPDMPQSTRQQALASIAGTETGARATVLMRMLTSVTDADAARSAGQLLQSLQPDELTAVKDQLTQLASAISNPNARIALAVLLTTMPDAAQAIDAPPAFLIEAATMLPDRGAPTWFIEHLRTAVTSFQVDPAQAVPALVRLAPTPGDLRPWLIKLAEGLRGRGFDDWGPEHLAGMAALRALNTAHFESDQPLAQDLVRTAPASEIIARGRDIFLDEAIGCARCHGVDGRGLEGFPPLRGSPWLLGNPERPAAIVTHGLHGKIATPDGRTFNAVMDPLGAVLDDTQVAAVLTYVRNAWGNYASAVTPDSVAKGRAAVPEGSADIAVLASIYPLSRDRLIGQSLAAVPIEHPAAPHGLRTIALGGIGLLLIPVAVAVILAIRTGAPPD